MVLRKQRIPYLEDSAVLFEAISHLPWPVFLDSARPMVEQGRYDIISAAPFETLVTRGEVTEIRADGSITRSTDDPFDLLRTRLAVAAQSVESELPFSGGAIGYFAYDLARRFERLPDSLEDKDDLPEMAVGIYDWAVVVDHEERCAWLVDAGRNPQTARLWDELVERFSHPPPIRERPFRVLTPVESSLDQTGYLQRFQRIQRYIRDGDCYQVNFALRYQAGVEGDGWSAYRRLRRINPAPFSVYLELPFATILSSSPERFLRVRQRRVKTSPIKGTAARRSDPTQHRAEIERLAASLKDRAENVMIVDLLRNDLGRVCETGSIEVTRLFEILSFARVHHMVSTVEGVLARDLDALSLLRACFPGGSITGAPKLRAMEIIEELEDARRGVYCGSIGCIGFDGNMDSNIAIRTLVKRSDRISFWAGGGVVADSGAEAEFQEIQDKAAAILETLLGCEG